jgi:hypothetical protein
MDFFLATGIHFKVNGVSKHSFTGLSKIKKTASPLF